MADLWGMLTHCIPAGCKRARPWLLPAICAACQLHHVRHPLAPCRPDADFKNSGAGSRAGYSTSAAPHVGRWEAAFCLQTSSHCNRQAPNQDHLNSAAYQGRGLAQLSCCCMCTQAAACCRAVHKNKPAAKPTISPKLQLIQCDQASCCNRAVEIRRRQTGDPAPHVAAPSVKGLRLSSTSVLGWLARHTAAAVPRSWALSWSTSLLASATAPMTSPTCE